MPLGQLNAQPRDVILGMLVGLGILTVVRDLLGIAERLRLAAELNRDPEAPARAAEEILREEEVKDVDE